MATVELDILKQQSRRLLPKQKLELIRYLSEDLGSNSESKSSSLLEYGKYRCTGLKMSSVDDFAIAEWKPTENELNGD